MHIPFARELLQLVLRELGVHERERDAMKRQVPCGIPRIFPLVRHGHDGGVVEVRPVGIATVLAFGWRRRTSRIAVQRLALDVALVFAGDAVLHLGVELVGFVETRSENRIEISEGLGAGVLVQAQPYLF